MQQYSSDERNSDELSPYTRCTFPVARSLSLCLDAIIYDESGREQIECCRAPTVH